MMASDNQCLHDVIERILASLGVRLTWIDADGLCQFGWWRLSSKQDPSKIVSMKTVDGVRVFGYRKLETLCSELCSEISKILIDEHEVANPYLGCRNLEEMQIRCDLLGT